MDYMRSLLRTICADEAEVEERCLLAFSLWIGSHFIAADHPGRSRAAVTQAAFQRLLEGCATGNAASTRQPREHQPPWKVSPTLVGSVSVNRACRSSARPGHRADRDKREVPAADRRTGARSLRRDHAAAPPPLSSNEPPSQAGARAASSRDARSSPTRPRPPAPAPPCQPVCRRTACAARSAFRNRLGRKSREETLPPIGMFPSIAGERFDPIGDRWIPVEVGVPWPV
jgi:hypothetical protein